MTRLWAGRPRNRVRFVAEVTCLFLLQTIQTSSGAHSASYSMDTRDSFPGATAARE